MSWKVQIAGEYLDGFFDFSFELNNSVFDTNNTSVLPGQFSFPADVELTPKNKFLLGNPHLVNNANPVVDIEDVWIYCYGAALFNGTLIILSANASKCKISIVANPIRSFKDKPLNQLDFGGDRTIGNSAAMLAHAKATALNPLDYDYVFAPIYNPNFLNNATGDDRANFQNYYKLTTDVFEVGHAYPAFMPFIRLEYMLERIFSECAYTFGNAFQVNDELRNIILYNNYSIWNKSGLPTTINLKNHASKTKSGDFLKKVIATFCLGLFTNPWYRTVKMIPINDLLSRQTELDWTKYAIKGQNVEKPTGGFDYISYKEESGDAVYQDFPVADVPPVGYTYQREVENLDEIESNGYPTGMYYVRSRHSYYYYNISPFLFRRVYCELGFAPVRTGDKIELTLPPLFDYEIFQGDGIDDPVDVPMAYIKTAGTVEYQSGTSGGSPVYTRQTADIPDRMTLYRGIQFGSGPGDYPLAHAHNYDGLEAKIGDYSLFIDGPDGIYQKSWRAWFNMLGNGKHVSQSFALPISELTAFSFEMKVKVENMDYYMKRLKVGKLLGNNCVLVDADMVSVF